MGSIVEFYSVGALTIRVGFWGMLYCNYNEDPPPKKSIGSYLDPYITVLGV